MKLFWYFYCFWQWYLFFTVNLNTYQHNFFFWRKLSKFTSKRINPFFHRFSSLKKVKFSDIAYSVRNFCSKWYLSPPPTGQICPVLSTKIWTLWCPLDWRITIHPNADPVFFPHNLDIYYYVGKLPEQHSSVWLFSNPGDKLLFLLKFHEARISEWNVCITEQLLIFRALWVGWQVHQLKTCHAWTIHDSGGRGREGGGEGGLTPVGRFGENGKNYWLFLIALKLKFSSSHSLLT